MTDRQQLQHLFQFDLWSTGILARLYMEKEPFYEQEPVLSQLSHIINAQNIWFDRLFPHHSQESSQQAWERFSAKDLYPKAKESTRKWIDFIADHERSEEHTSELQSRGHLVCRLLLAKKQH